MPLLAPEDIETASLPRAKIRGYDRRSTDQLLRDVAVAIRFLQDERGRLEDEVRRLKEALEHSELTEKERVREIQEPAKRECDLILRKARRQADKVRNAAERDTAIRVGALKRVEEVQGLVRVELRTLLGAMLEVLDTPSDVVRESLKNRQLMADLHLITRAAIEASAGPTPDSSVEVDAGKRRALPASATSQLAGRIDSWTTHTRGE